MIHTVLIRGGEVSAEPFVADGEEIQLNDKRFDKGNIILIHAHSLLRVVRQVNALILIKHWE